MIGSGLGSATAIGSELEIGKPWQYPLDYAALRILNQGSDKVSIKTGTGKIQLGDSQLILTQHTPASATEACTTGTFNVDAGYVYVCTATNTWKRAALATW